MGRRMVRSVFALIAGVFMIVAIPLFVARVLGDGLVSGVPSSPVPRVGPLVLFVPLAVWALAGGVGGFTAAAIAGRARALHALLVGTPFAVMGIGSIISGARLAGLYFALLLPTTALGGWLRARQSSRGPVTVRGLAAF
jgi:hypothetical protein